MSSPVTKISVTLTFVVDPATAVDIAEDYGYSVAQVFRERVLNDVSQLPWVEEDCISVSVKGA